MSKIELFTIGFTKKRAEEFFSILRKAGVTVVFDIRLNNNSQLAGFAKRDDLAYFLKALCNCGYKHLPLLAPTKEILKDYQKRQIDWPTYERRFNKLISERAIENTIPANNLNGACLLCSEATAKHCHRRLVAEYLKTQYPDVQITHL